MFAENYPEHLDSLNISCNMVSIHNLNNMMKQVASIKDITLSIKDINAHEKDQFYSITNWLLGPHMHCQSASLTVTGIKFDLDDARISWTNVSKLLVVSLIKYETLTQLLRKCKSLQSLATGLDLTTHVAGSWDHMQDNVLPPINTSLEALRIVGMSQEVDKNKVCEAFKGLLFQLPALSKLNLSFGIQLHISDMVEKYKDVYPHLPNIAVSQGRIILLNRSNGRMRALFTRTGAPSLSIQSRTYNQ
ncbi:hypothetical protein LPJ56_000582 [Coemansia sp. RSA 2599]|nr:hypothetical protein LPJ75_000279 [Coemansia sp. RSA 2598]KAJ1829156.1 hypothetical protein LPJ56_000582 [Coemansia sp. RSA 2599]